MQTNDNIRDSTEGSGGFRRSAVPLFRQNDDSAHHTSVRGKAHGHPAVRRRLSRERERIYIHQSPVQHEPRHGKTGQ